MRYLASCLMVMLTLAPALASAQTKNGFRDMRWGDAPTKEFERIDGLDMKKYGDAVVAYRRRSDKLFIGETAVEGIFYFFDDNKLRGVYVFVKRGAELDAKVTGKSSFSEVVKIVEALHGNGRLYKHDGMAGCIWETDNTRIDLKYLAIPGVEANGTTLEICDKSHTDSLELKRKVKVFEKAAAEGRDDL